VPVLLRPEQQADATHEDARADGERHVQVSLLRHAVQRDQHAGEAHEEVHRQHPAAEAKASLAESILKWTFSVCRDKQWWGLSMSRVYVYKHCTML
jgi:hypothetical protein